MTTILCCRFAGNGNVIGFRSLNIKTVLSTIRVLKGHPGFAAQLLQSLRIHPEFYFWISRFITDPHTFWTPDFCIYDHDRVPAMFIPLTFETIYFFNARPAMSLRYCIPSKWMASTPL